MGTWLAATNEVVLTVTFDRANCYASNPAGPDWSCTGPASHTYRHLPTGIGPRSGVGGYSPLGTLPGRAPQAPPSFYYIMLDVRDNRGLSSRNYVQIIVQASLTSDSTLTGVIKAWGSTDAIGLRQSETPIVLRRY